MSKYRFSLNLQLFADEDGGEAASVVHAPVDAELYQEVVAEHNSASGGDAGGTGNDGNAGNAEAGGGTGETTVGNGTVDASAPTDPKVGEAIRREVERREAKLKEQFEQQYAPMSKYSDALKRRARQEGYGDDVEGYLQAIDELEQRMTIEQEARRMGMDPQAYRQFIAPVTEKASQLEHELNSLKSQLTERQKQEEKQSKWGALYEAFPELLDTAKAFTEGSNPEWFNETMQSYYNRGYDPVDAYRLAHAETIVKRHEQQMLARITGRDERQVLPSNDSPAQVQFDPSNMTDKQLDELSERARNGERITL